MRNGVPMGGKRPGAHILASAHRATEELPACVRSIKTFQTAQRMSEGRWCDNSPVVFSMGREAVHEAHKVLCSHEFISITSSVTTGAGAPGNGAGRNRVPSPDYGPLASTGGSGTSRCGSAWHGW